MMLMIMSAIKARTLLCNEKNAHAVFAHE